MWRAFWSFSLRSTDFVNIFVIATAILALETSVRYVTKLPIIGSKPPDPVAKRAAHFDCLRLGVDLSFMGLVAGLAVLELAYRVVQQGRTDAMTAYLAVFLLIQFFLIILAAMFTAIFNSPETEFQRGIWIPSLIGFVSIYFSAAVLTALSQ